MVQSYLGEISSMVSIVSAGSYTAIWCCNILSISYPVTSCIHSNANHTGRGDHEIWVYCVILQCIRLQELDYNFVSIRSGWLHNV